MKRTLISLALGAALLIGINSNTAQADSSTGALGTIIGAAAGGVLGSTVGKGDGRLVATAAGTLIGAVIGHEMATEEDDYYQPRQRPTRVVTRETVKTVYVPETRVVVVEEKHRKDHPNKKWQRVARYEDKVLVCHERSDRCHWTR